MRMANEVFRPTAQGTVVEGREKGVERPLLPNQIPIRDHKEAWMKQRPPSEIASIEGDLGTVVERDYIEMMQGPDTEIAGTFAAIRRGFLENGVSLESHVLVGPKNKETRWGKLMLAIIGWDRKVGNKTRTLYPRLERPVGGRVHGSVVAFEAGLNASALYLQGQYGWDWIPEYKVEATGISEDDIRGHNPKVAAARTAEIEASKPPKQIEQKK